MPQRIAKIEQRYAARTIKVGETFDVHSNDVRILLALGRIKPEKGEPGYVVPPTSDLKSEKTVHYQTKVMVSEDAPVTNTAVLAPDSAPNPALSAEVQDSVVATASPVEMPKKSQKKQFKTKAK